MGSEHVHLVEPLESFRDEFIAYCEEFDAAGEPVPPGWLREAQADFSALICRWRDTCSGVNVPPDRVPQSIFWLVQGQRIIGVSNLRPRLHEALAFEGGHIGYQIRPSDRRKGYATCLLKLTLVEARKQGLKRVMLTCQKKNVGSVRTIEKNGGRLEAEFTSKGTGRPALRYWIDL